MDGPKKPKRLSLAGLSSLPECRVCSGFTRKGCLEQRLQLRCEKVLQHWHLQLGFVMRLNWNVSIDTLDNERKQPSLNQIRFLNNGKTNRTKPDLFFQLLNLPHFKCFASKQPKPKAENFFHVIGAQFRLKLCQTTFMFSPVSYY